MSELRTIERGLDMSGLNGAWKKRHTFAKSAAPNFHSTFFCWGDYVSYLRRLAKVVLDSVSEGEKIVAEAVQEVSDITSKIATEVEKPSEKKKA